ncbi:hypothetical protein AAU61_10135 [Desulfocarbo indianensis]|nr:hypothetical protein AAU61_10135 [Desulfocarbo indianensis]
MDIQDGLTISSCKLRAVYMGLLVMSPILLGIYWVMVGLGNAELASHLPVTLDAETPTISLVAGYFISLIPTGVLMYALYQLYKLFTLYGKGVLLDLQNVACYKSLGKAILYYELAAFLSEVALGIILTLHRGEGNRLLVINLSGSDLFIIVTGVTMLSLAKVMETARQMVKA